MTTGPATVTTTFVIHALPVDVLVQARQQAAGTAPDGPRQLTATGGEPLRCCLRDAETGAATEVKPADGRRRLPGEAGAWDRFSRAEARFPHEAGAWDRFSRRRAPSAR